MIFFILILALARHVYPQHVGISGLFFGPAYMVTPWPNASIVGYTATLRVPKVPKFSNGLLVIWPGINTPGVNTPGASTNLVQSCRGVGGATASATPTAALPELMD